MGHTIHVVQEFLVLSCKFRLPFISLLLVYELCSVVSNL